MTCRLSPARRTAAADGGTDALPGMINAQVQERGTRAFVCADGHDQMQAFICCQVRGGAVWVWGARTAPALRGCRLATQLMEHVEAHAASLPGVHAVLTTTIMANPAMRRILEKLEYQQQAQMDIWPSYAGSAAGSGSLLSRLPGLQELLADAGALADRWQQCRSACQLQQLLLWLRRRRLDSAELREAAAALPGGGAHAALTWLPADYVLWPLETGFVHSLLERGQIWALECEEEDGHRVAGVLLIDVGQHGTTFAGVVADCPAALESAVRKTLEIAPDVERFYVDRCDAFDHGTLLELGGRQDYLALHKVLQHNIDSLV